MFGKRLKDLREDRDLTQKDLGLLFGVSDRTIGMYEQERREPDIKTLNKFADFFGCTTDYLLCRTNIKTAIIVTDKVSGSDIKLEIDKKVYPNGLTHEEVLKKLEAIEKLGFKLPE